MSVHVSAVVHNMQPYAQGIRRQQKIFPLQIQYCDIKVSVNETSHEI